MFALLITLLTSAWADTTIDHGHSVPESVRMFERVRLTKAVGKVSGEGCDAALRAAYTDLERVMGKAGTSDVIAVYTLNEREGWAQPQTVQCQDNGKKQTVKLEALVVDEGESNAYRPIAGPRVIEIVEAIQGDSNMLIAARIQAMRITDQGGKLYYGGSEVEYDGTFGPDDSRNTRAVTVMRETLLPQMRNLGQLLAAVPEFEGAELSATATRINKKGEEETDRFLFRVPTQEVQQFFRGEITEQQLVDAGAVLYDDGAHKTRMDVSFVQAED